MKKLTLATTLMTIFLFLSCNPKFIKGTKIPQTKDNIAVIEVFEKYAMAMKKKQPKKILALVSKSYYDENGTNDTSDDIDYNSLKKFLNSPEFKKITKMNIYFLVKDLQISEDKKTAKILFYYDLHFKEKAENSNNSESIYKSSKTKWQKVRDVNKMEMVKENGKWKIISGI